MNVLSPAVRSPMVFISAPWLDRISLVACLLLPWLLIVSRAGSDAASIVIGVLFLLRSWQTADWAWTQSPVVRICAIAWLWMLCIASPFATDSAESFKTALPWLRWMLLYAGLVYWVLATSARLRLCALNIAFMLCLIVFDTIWQYYFGVSITGHIPNENYRLTGPMDNVKVGIFISKLCFPATAIILFQAMQQHRAKHIVATIIFLLANIATVMLSGERTAFFSCLLAMGIITAIIIYAEPALRMKSILATAIVLLITGGLLATQPVLQARVAWLQTNIENFKTSSYGTLDRIGIEMGLDHWTTGAGFKGFRELCPTYLAPGEPDQCNIHPHNPYVEWFAELGMPGLLLFLALITTLIFQALQAIKTNKGAGRVLAASVLAVLAMQFFPLMATQSFFSNWPALLLWYSISVAVAALNMLKSPLE